MKIPIHEEYWQEVMKNRMPIDDEVTRLKTALMGFMYSHNEYSKESNRHYDIMDILEFWDSKRPYGNKSIENSIAYNLGWDRDRLLITSMLPEWVKDEAMKLHELVKEDILENGID